LRNTAKVALMMPAPIRMMSGLPLGVPFMADLRSLQRAADTLVVTP
jgi:hypothetical protein